MTLVKVISTVGHSPGCKGLCTKLNLVVKWSRRCLAYTNGTKYCRSCEQYLRCDKRNCPCCGCHLRTRKRNRKRSTNANATLGPSTITGKYSPDAIAKISAALTGKKRTPEQRKRMSLAHMGNHHRKGTKTSDQARINMSNAQKGKRFSEETRRKMSLAHVELRRRKLQQNVDIDKNTSMVYQ